MNRQDRISLCEGQLSGTAMMLLIRTDSEQPCDETRDLGTRLGAKPRDAAELIPQAERGRRTPPEWAGREPLIGPSSFLAACSWFLFSWLPSLGRLLMAGGPTTRQLARQARTTLMGCVRFVGRWWAPANVAARIDSTLGLRRKSARAATICQTLRNRELGQLCQLGKWLKRYKTGMFANLAMLANVFSQNRPPAGPQLIAAPPMSPNAGRSDARPQPSVRSGNSPPRRRVISLPLARQPPLAFLPRHSVADKTAAPSRNWCRFRAGPQVPTSSVVHRVGRS